MLKPNKKVATDAAIALTPQYLSLLRDLRVGGSVAWPSELSKVRAAVGSYVKYYEDERRIGTALLLALMGEEELAALDAELKVQSEDEQQEWLDQNFTLTEADVESLFEGFELPHDDQGWKALRQEFELLPLEEQQRDQKRGAYFWSYFFSSFFNTLSLMIHGAKLTALVPRALAGDDDAFLKAVQIDRMLLLQHPYFIERKRDAQERGDFGFLRRLANREICSPVQSRLRYPGLYMLFGVLDAYRWLDAMKHEEILAIVDAAGLDRYQNRVEDLNYLTKRLSEYRRWQKTAALSML